MSEKRTRKTRIYDRAQVISVVNPVNPRRKGSNRWSIFEEIRDGMTVGDFLEVVAVRKGGTKDLQLLVESGHIEITPNSPPEEVQPFREEPAMTPR